MIDYNQMLDETNKIILINERLIKKLNAKIIKLESKIKESETLIKEIKNQNNYESHISKIGVLKAKI
jgi:hypothetical protein